MVWPESQLTVCKYHPFEIPQPGICPSCLRQRLSEIAASSSTPSSSTSNRYYSNNFYSSGDSGFGSSPPRSHQRVASDVVSSISMAIGAGLNKSRSVVGYGYAPRNNNNNINAASGGRSKDDLKRKKKRAGAGGGGFWNRLRILSVGGGGRAG